MLLPDIVVLLSTLVATLTYASDFEVMLAPSRQTVRQGEQPRFTITVTAVDAPQRVLRLAEREDFRANYARLAVTRDGKAVSLLQAISDPGPTSERDYIMLRPGETVAFQHNGEPFALSELPPATYSVVVKLRPDWRVEAILSNSVSFTVEPR